MVSSCFTAAAVGCFQPTGVWYTAPQALIPQYPLGTNNLAYASCFKFSAAL